MKTASKLLLNVLVKQFYIANAGFLLFVFFIFFGIVNGGQLLSYHQSLIMAMLTSPVFMVIVCMFWFMYNLKCVQFCGAVIKAPESKYIYTLKSLPNPQQFILYLLVALLQYLPVLSYSVFVVAVAITQSMTVNAVAVVVFQILMIVLAAALLHTSINKNNIATKVEKLFAFLTPKYKLSVGYFGFLLANIFYNRKIALVVVKAFSILLLSISFVRNGDKFDEDLFGIFLQLIFTAHALLVFYCVDFLESQLQFSRNLPIPFYRVAMMFLFTFTILLLPELAFMLINNQGNLPVTQILLLYLTAVSMLYFYTAVLYGCALNMEGYMLIVFISFVVIFFLEKTGMIFLNMLGILTAATILLKTNYYSFERE